MGSCRLPKKAKISENFYEVRFFRQIVGVGTLYAFWYGLIQLFIEFYPEIRHRAIGGSEIHWFGLKNVGAVFLNVTFVD